MAHEEAAEIAFMAGISEFEEAGLFGQEHTALTLESVVDSCMGVIDSGATASLASIDALEKVRTANLQNHGEALMEVDVNKKPVYRFGNGAKSECLSTVTMGLGAGEHRGRFEVHVHEAPGQPVLISKKALKALGAVLDFETGEIIYKKVDRSKVVKLQEAPNGHLLMPLTGNLLDGAKSRSTPFDSLFE